MTIHRHSFWWSNSPPDFALQSQLPPYQDIVIIGAGFAGISTAYWLARLSQKSKTSITITVLEEAPHPAFKATGRMNGSIYLGTHKTPQDAVSKHGNTVARKLYEYSAANNSLLDALIKKIPCDAEFNGGFRMANTAKEAVGLKSSVDILEKWDIHPVYFDHNKSQHVVIAPLVKGSLFIPHEGMFDAFKFVNSAARVLRHSNVRIVYGARVKEVYSNDDGAVVVLDNDHRIATRKAVHTTSSTVSWDRIKEVITHKRETVIRTSPLPKELDDMPLPLMPIELNDGKDSIRIHDGSVIMTGGKAGLKNGDPEVDVMDDSWYNQRVLDHLDATMIRNFPFTNHTEVSHTWTYIETDTKDELPLIGEIPEHNGQYVNIAYGRNKFGLAFLGSKNIAEQLLRKKVSNNKFNIFAPKRLTRGE